MNTLSSKRPLKILQVSPEVAPLAKVGGLADVVGALTKQMAKLGHEVKIICPKYGFLQVTEQWEIHADAFAVKLGMGREAYCRLWKTRYPDCSAELILIEYHKYYDRHEIYTGPWGSHQDNHERFILLSRAAIDYCHAFNWYPDVIQCHDWTVGFVPVYLNTTEFGTPLSKAASIFSIHNLQHQGVFGIEALDLAGLPRSLFRADNVEAMGAVNMMKAGLYHSTKLTTVSPTYAREIQTTELGCGLDNVLKYRAGDLVGILNGIDTEEWNPQTDRFIPAHFSADDLSGKAECKVKLQQEFGLQQNPGVPIYAAIARLYDQKGLDMLAEIIPQIMHEMAVQIIVLGAGDHGLESAFNWLASQYPGRVGVYIGYNHGLSHRIEAGSDFFIMPSRFEPCGLNQLYSMRYGTLPIVRTTGGLVDSVQQYREGSGSGTGFCFEEPSPRALYYTIGWACATYYDRPKEFRALQQNAMRQDLSWNTSANAYLNVYKWAIENRLRGLGIVTPQSLSRAPF